MQRPLRPQRRARLVDVGELRHDPPHGVSGGGARRRHLGRVGEQIAELAQHADRHAQAAGQEVAHRLRPGWFGYFLGLDVLIGDRRRFRSVTFEVEELERQLHAAFAVGDRVVELLDQRRAAFAQTVDQDELPQRTGPVERVGGDQRGEVEQLAHGTGLRQREVADVVVQIELRIVDPERRVEVCRRGLHALAQAGDHVHRTVHSTAQVVEFDLAIEDRHVAERRREVRILLEAPHQPLGVGHPPVEPGGISHRPEATPRHAIGPRPPAVRTGLRMAPPCRDAAVAHGATGRANGAVAWTRGGRGRSRGERLGQRGMEVCLNSLRIGHST